MTDAEITRMVEARITELEKRLMAKINSGSTGNVNGNATIQRMTASVPGTSGTASSDQEAGAVVFIGYN